MPYVQVPKDLLKVKTKLAFNLTKRQLICFSGAAAVGIPVYLLTRPVIGNSPALFLMIGLMLPFFFFAMFERDGLPFEKILRNYIRARFLWPQVRPYKTENFYAAWSGPSASGQVGPKPEDTERRYKDCEKEKRQNRPRPNGRAIRAGNRRGRRPHSRQSRSGKCLRTAYAA